jgi:hypothetical protein
MKSASPKSWPLIPLPPLLGLRRPDSFAARGWRGSNSVPMNTFESDIAVCAQPADTSQIARRSLLSLFPIALIYLSGAAVAKADKRTASRAHATLYNEDLSDPKGHRYAGVVLWRTFHVMNDGQPDDIAIHADVEVPELGMKMGFDFKHNTNPSIPASHVIELKFAVPDDDQNLEVISVPGLLMKSGEQAQGVALSGRPVKFSKGSFSIDLSSGDRERNLQLLRERQWIDIPMIYANQHRGILAIEKGYDGEQMFNDAMGRWEQSR